MNVEVQEAMAKKENQVLLVTLGIKDKLDCRALKETQDQQGLLVLRGIRVSKDNQVSQDHPDHQVLLAKLEEKGFLGSKGKRATMVLKALKAQADPPAHPVLQD